MAAPFLGCVGLGFSEVSTDPYPPSRTTAPSLPVYKQPSTSEISPWADLPPELRIVIVSRLLLSPTTTATPPQATCPSTTASATPPCTSAAPSASSPAAQATEALQCLRDFVVCAGVSKAWRESCLEHFATISPAVQSRALIFPQSLSVRGPDKGPRVRCLLKKVKNVTELYMQAPGTDLEFSGRLIMSASKQWRPWGTTYTVSTAPEDFSRKGGSLLGKIGGKRMAGFKSNPGMEDEFKIEAAERRPDGDTAFARVAAVVYSLNPHREAVKRRVMEVVLQPTPTLKAMALECDGDLVFRSKAPRWSAVRKTWWLNFGGRVTVPSVRNFQLIGMSKLPSPEPAGFMDPDFEDPSVLLQSGKVGKGLYTLDYKAPFSAFEAFAIVLSNMETSHGMDR